MKKHQIIITGAFKLLVHNFPYQKLAKKRDYNNGAKVTSRSKRLLGYIYCYVPIKKKHTSKSKGIDRPLS